MAAKGSEREGSTKCGAFAVRVSASIPKSSYLEGGMLLHVPQQLWLLGRRVVTHSALELLP